jgi:uncharacterized protein YndB with AHSA1/START domain
MDSATQGFRTVLELPSDTEAVVVRQFAASAERVFDAWTRPGEIRQWYGFEGMEMSVCEVDLREGGRWRWVHTSPDGTEVAFSGVYRLVERPRRLDFSEVYEMMPGTDFEVTMTFDESDGLTTLRHHMRYQSKEHRDGHLQSGMEAGTRYVHQRLDALFAQPGRL